MNRAARRITSVADGLELARRRLPRSIMQQFENGAGAMITHDANVRAFEEVMFRPQHGTFTAGRDQTGEVLGHLLRTPLVASAVGMLGLAHPDGETGVARAVGEAGGMVFVSGGTSTPIEEIVAAADCPVYYQLYFTGSGRAGMGAVIDRVRRAGVNGLIVSVDSVIGHTPVRHHPIRTRRRLPQGTDLAEVARFLPQLVTKPGWAIDFARGRIPLGCPMALDADGRPISAADARIGFTGQWIDWGDLPWIREVWDCPVIVKGVLSAAEARRAVDAGAVGVVVSNHGGNRLDGTIPSLPQLPGVVAAVGDEVDVLFDSGVRTGPDVVKAIALGAKAVGLGRAYLYPFVAAGEDGVRRILEILVGDIDRTLAYCACESLDGLSPQHLELPDSFSPR